MNLEQTCVYCFIIIFFVCFKVNLDLEKKKNQLGESSPNFIFAVENLDSNILEKRWTDDLSWPNGFVEKVNRGEDLRWVGSRCPLLRALAEYPMRSGRLLQEIHKQLNILQNNRKRKIFFLIGYMAYLMIEGASTIVVYGKHIFRYSFLWLLYWKP